MKITVATAYHPHHRSVNLILLLLLVAAIVKPSASSLVRNFERWKSEREGNQTHLVRRPNTNSSSSSLTPTRKGKFYTDESLLCEERLQLAATTLFSPKNFQSEISLLMKTYYNWGELLAPAPVAISTLGQLILMSNQRMDFPIDAYPPKEGFKHIEYPKSFRATLVQISHRGYMAFLKAHTNMDEIRIVSATIPGHVNSVVRYLTSQNQKVISMRLPSTLTKIRESADKSKKLAQDISDKFKQVLDLIKESVLAVTVTKDRRKSEFEKVKQRLEAAQSKEQYSVDEANLLKDKNGQLDAMLNNLETRQRDLYLETRYGDECVATQIDETNQKPSAGGAQRPLADRHPELFLNAGNWRYTFEESRLNVDHCLEENGQKLVDLLMTSHNFQLKCESWQEEESTEAQLDVAEELENLFRALDALPDCPSLKMIVKMGGELKEQLSQAKIKALEKTDECPGVHETENLAVLVADARANQIKEVYEEKTIVLNSVRDMKDAHVYVRQHQKGMMKDLMETSKKMLDFNVKKMQTLRTRMEEILKDIQGWKNVNLTYKEALQVLEKGMLQLGRLKNDWDKLVEFFTRFASLTDQAAQGSYAFIFFTSPFYNPNRVVDDDQVFVEKLIDHAEKANAASLLVVDLASVYVNVSNRYIMDKMAGLSRLLSLDVRRIGTVGIEKEQAALAENGRLALDGILKLMAEEETKTQQKLLDRRKELAKGYKKLMADCSSTSSQLPPSRGDDLNIEEVDETIDAEEIDRNKAETDKDPSNENTDDYYDEVSDIEW